MSTLSPSKASKSPSKGSAHETCAHAAHAAMAEDHPGRCRCPGNDELYLFLMYLLESEEQKAASSGLDTGTYASWCTALRKATRSVRDYHLRIASTEELQKLAYVGPLTAKVVQHKLWSLYPPDPLTEEEQAERNQLKEQAEAAKAAEKARKLQERRSAKAASKAAGPAAAQQRGKAAVPSVPSASIPSVPSASVPSVPSAAMPCVPPTSVPSAVPASDSGAGVAGTSGGLDVVLPLAIASAYNAPAAKRAAPKAKRKQQEANQAEGGPSQCGQGEKDGDGEGDQPKPKKARAVKEYVPKVGSANYAFLVVMYMEMKRGIPHETKASLMRKAEVSGLSNTPIFNQSGNNMGMVRAGEQYYDGWSSFNKSLINRTPPLVMAWSNPKIVKLVQPEGVALAARLYDDALMRGKVEPLLGVDHTADMTAAMPQPTQHEPPTAAAAVRPEEGSQTLHRHSQLHNVGGSMQGLPQSQAGRSEAGAVGRKEAGQRGAGVVARAPLESVEANVLLPRQQQQAVGPERGYAGGVQGVTVGMGEGGLRLEQQQPQQQQQQQQQESDSDVEVVEVTPLVERLQRAALQAKAAEARAATQACPPAAVSQGQAALRSRQEPQATSRQEPQAAPGTLQHPQAGSQQPWVAPHASAELQRSTGAWDALDASTGLQRSTSTSARQGLGGRTHRRAGSVGGSCGAGNGIGGAAIMPSSGTSSDSGMAGTAGPVTGMGVACLAQLPLDEASRHVPAPQLPLDEASRHAPALQLPLDEASRHVPSSQGLQGSGQQGAGCAMPLRGFDTDERTAALLGELYSAFGCGDLGAAPGATAAAATGGGDHGMDVISLLDSDEGEGDGAEPCAGHGTAAAAAGGGAAAAAAGGSDTDHAAAKGTHKWGTLSHGQASGPISTQRLPAGPQANSSRQEAAASSPSERPSRRREPGGDAGAAGLGADMSMEGSVGFEQELMAAAQGPSASLAAACTGADVGAEAAGAGFVGVGQRRGGRGRGRGGQGSGGGGSGRGERGSGGSAAGPSRVQGSGGSNGPTSSAAGPSCVSAADAAAAAAAAAAEIVQPYQWSLPCMGTMPQDGSPPLVRLPPIAAGSSFEREYEVVMLLDNRERFVQRVGSTSLTGAQSRPVHMEQMRARGVTVEERSLSIGDVVWVARRKAAPNTEYVLEFVIERKSVSDLLSSIQESSKQRFQRQKWWLMRCGLRQPGYLLEGDATAQRLKESDLKTWKTVNVANELDGLRMFRSSGPPGTLTLLTRLTHAIARAYSAAAALAAGNGSRQQLEQPPLYPDWSTRVRRMRDSRTIQDVWGQMLCAVPGLGQQTVEAITARYPTLPSLWSAYHQALSAPGGNKDGARMLLARLPHVNGLGSVSEAKSAIVYDTLFEGGS